MLIVRSSIIVICLLLCLITHASHKIYLIHGYAGNRYEFEKIKKAIDKKGYVSEIFSFNSFVQEIDSVSSDLYVKIRSEKYDSISFVTHSMGALIVRSLYGQIDSTTPFPFIHRLIMIASPNKGSPLADFWVQFDYLNFIFGPNVVNLTTNPETGAGKYPIPTCEVGLIVGIAGIITGYNFFIKGDNDGVVPANNTKLGIEKDIAFVKAPHIGLSSNSKVVKLVLNFFDKGTFKIK
ncbi:MAG: hypothetical protein Q7U47_13360 [Paludibacter sp.]|nr:hypothetical protein [Paludibacter sp.]